MDVIISYFVNLRAIGLSSYLACVFSYPFGVMSRQLVDFWPKEKGGVCTFQGNYRKAMVWVII
jgi:hypothetical protein